MHKVDETALAAAQATWPEPWQNYNIRSALRIAITAYLAALPPEQSAAQQPATDAVEADRVDAERWRALLRCARIRMQGSAGFDPKTGERQQYSNATGEYEATSDGWVHFGAEFWSIWPGAEDPNPDTRWGTVALKALADDVLLKERAALSQSPAKPAGDSLQQRPAAEEKRP